MIFTSSKADATFVSRLQQPANLLGQAEQPDYDVRLKKSNIFHPRAALLCLQHLHVTGMPEDLSSSERLHLLGSMINLANVQQLGALGALLAILHQEGLLSGASTESASRAYALGVCLHAGRSHVLETLEDHIVACVCVACRTEGCHQWQMCSMRSPVDATSINSARMQPC